MFDRLGIKARWQSGYAAACKAVDTGSTPVRASIFIRDDIAGAIGGLGGPS